MFLTGHTKHLIITLFRIVLQNFENLVPSSLCPMPIVEILLIFEIFTGLGELVFDLGAPATQKCKEALY